MMKRNAEGKLAGYKMQPFNYSDSWLCGTKKYWAREKAELARVADFTAHGWGEEGLGPAASRGGARLAWAASAGACPSPVSTEATEAPRAPRSEERLREGEGWGLKRRKACDAADRRFAVRFFLWCE